MHMIMNKALHKSVVEVLDKYYGRKGKSISRATIPVTTKHLFFYYRKVVQCNQPVIKWLAGSPGNGAISEAQCGSLLLTGYSARTITRSVKSACGRAQHKLLTHKTMNK